MKFLHTADWHLGAKTNGRDRLTEQKRTLDEIESIANYENIDCVIIAGDIFNTATPSAETEELFFETIQKLSNGGDRFVFVLAGNHDDPTRLSAGLPLASKHNIALASSLAKMSESSFNKNGITRVVETGKGHIKIQKNQEIATIAYLPYPSESRITEKVDSSLSYAEKVAEWAKISASAFGDDTFNIFVSHLFMVGSKTNDGIIKVGDIMAVPTNMLPKADYTALGHIHSSQEVGKNVFYSGAITKLNIKNTDLSVNIVESENGKLVDIKKIALKNPAKYQKLSVHSIEEANDLLLNYDNLDIIELEFIQTEPLSASSIKALKKDFPCISNISLVRPTAQNGELRQTSRISTNDVDLFKDFYKSVRGTEPSEDLVKMFIDCKGDENETN